MIDQLRLKLGDQVRENVSLKEFTTFKIGGPAKFLIEVGDKVQLFRALKVAQELSLPFFILGGGSNILISDNGFDGLVIRLIDAPLEITGNSLKGFAGIRWPKVVMSAVRAGLEGLEFSANIPGTIGGNVRGNAGAYGKAAGDFVREVEVLIVGDKEVAIKVLSKEECQFAYRESIFKREPTWIISEVTFDLNKSARTTDELLEKIKIEALARLAKQPLNFPSAGSCFKNIVYTSELEEYQSWLIQNKIPAAKFIEETGLKGKIVGGAQISEKHANFIVNLANATASDVIQLISLVKTTVRDTFSVQLEEEIQYVGF